MDDLDGVSGRSGFEGVFSGVRVGVLKDLRTKTGIARRKAKGKRLENM